MSPIAYGPYGAVGRFLAEVGIPLSNNAGSFVLAQVYGGLAYFTTAARTAFENVPIALEEVAHDLGATPFQYHLFRGKVIPVHH
jgi:molybdate/tungstate transport system permease protein